MRPEWEEGSIHYDDLRKDEHSKKMEQQWQGAEMKKSMVCFQDSNMTSVAGVYLNNWEVKGHVSEI